MAAARAEKAEADRLANERAALEDPKDIEVFDEKNPYQGMPKASTLFKPAAADFGVPEPIKWKDPYGSEEDNESK